MSSTPAPLVPFFLTPALAPNFPIDAHYIARPSYYIKRYRERPENFGITPSVYNVYVRARVRAGAQS